MKTVYFSNYIDQANIKVNPSILEIEGELHRFSLTIPFHNRKGEGNAIVFLKNPSNAGKIVVDEEGENRKVSDDTIYNVTDYLYKQKKFQKVIIVNLFTIVSGNTERIKGCIGKDRGRTYQEANDKEILRILHDYHEEKDIIIAAWGASTSLKKGEYDKRIKEVLRIIEDRPLYRVGPMVGAGRYPGHGKYWYDYEEIRVFPDSILKTFR